jgi:hypothetical protein
MLRPILLTGTCLMALLAGCATQGHPQQAAKAQGTAGCVQDTGSRLPRTPGSCPALGRTYTGDDLQRTGEENVGEALQKLDPSITVHH